MTARRRLCRAAVAVIDVAADACDWLCDAAGAADDWLTDLSARLERRSEGTRPVQRPSVWDTPGVQDPIGDLRTYVLSGNLPFRNGRLHWMPADDGGKPK